MEKEKSMIIATLHDVAVVSNENGIVELEFEVDHFDFEKLRKTLLVECDMNANVVDDIIQIAYQRQLNDALISHLA